MLEVFHKLLRDYEPQPSDFIEEVVELQGEQIPAHKPPGHSIMFHLLNDSPMLTLCLSLLEEGVRQLDAYASFPGERTYSAAVRVIQTVNVCVCVCVCVCSFSDSTVHHSSPAGKKHLESAVLHCLCLLDLALQKEVVFMDLLRESQASLLVSPLEQLLQGVSPQTRRADHIVNIARSEHPHIRINQGTYFC